MTDITTILRKIRENRGMLEKEFGIVKVRVFGSYVRGQQRENSDLDLIVKFKKTPGFIKLMQIEEKLSSILGVKVDLLTEEGISPYIKEYVEKEAIEI